MISGKAYLDQSGGDLNVFEMDYFFCQRSPVPLGVTAETQRIVRPSVGGGTQYYEVTIKI